MILKTRDHFIKKEEGVRVHVVSECCAPLHKHDFIELVYVMEGEAHQVIGNREYLIEEGDMFMLDAGVAHSLESDRPFTLCDILFMPEFFSSAINVAEDFIDLAYRQFFNAFIEDEAKDGFLYVTKDKTAGLKPLIDEIIDEFQHKRPGYVNIIQAHVSALLIKMLRLCDTQVVPLPSDQLQIVKEITDYIDAHIGEKLNIQKVSRAMFFSPSYISKLFKETTGGSLSKFIQSKRMNMAANELANSQKPIDDIISEVGYCAKKVFYDNFFEYSGMTPGEYRKKHRK